jgi:hypothetical protein
VSVANYRKATILLHVGVGGITFSGTNKIEFKLTHAGDDGSYSDVTADDLIGDAYLPSTITTGIVRSLVADHPAATVQKIGYIGGKKNLKLLADFGGTHGTGTPISATVILEDGDYEGAV